MQTIASISGHRPTVSVALAAYNGAEYIAGQLQSLLKQTQVPDEIVISDDSPDDRTWAAVKPFLTHPQVVYLRNNNPPGIAGNFANALQHCRGEYIFLCDQDDVWLSGKVERLAGELASSPELDGVFCNSLLVNSNLQPLKTTLFEVRKFTSQAQKQLLNAGALELFLKRVPLSGHNTAFKRRWLEKLLPFPELAPFYPDTWIALTIAAAGKWKALNEIHTHYRVHQNNQSSPRSAQWTAAGKARKNQAPLRNALLAEEILQRNPENIAPPAQAQLQQFIEHHSIRSKYAPMRLIRSWQIFREYCSGRYDLYSNGIKSAIADCIWY
ncbi:MAG: glycosyltransferase [Lentisphaerae bacterium]|nr:glycosyltransferase [Lentisphaerota bacterium]